TSSYDGGVDVGGSAVDEHCEFSAGSGILRAKRLGGAPRTVVAIDKRMAHKAHAPDSIGPRDLMLVCFTPVDARLPRGHRFVGHVPSRESADSPASRNVGCASMGLFMQSISHCGFNPK